MKLKLVTYFTIVVITTSLAFADNTIPINNHTTEVTVKLCEPSTVFANNSFTCLCSDDGQTAVCSSYEIIINDGKINAPTTMNPNLVCQPDTVFQSGDCNTCKCDSTGENYHCTTRECAKPTTTCEPNTRFQRNCNSCYCSQNGVTATCSLYPCGDDNRFCVPNTMYRQGCLACICDKNGRGGQCMSRHCSGNRYCRPNQIFKAACNLCKCSNNGTGATCTLNRCGQDRAVMDFEELEKVLQTVDTDAEERLIGNDLWDSEMQDYFDEYFSSFFDYD